MNHGLVSPSESTRSFPRTLLYNSSVTSAECPAVHHREVATLRALGEQMTHGVRAVGDAGGGGGACILPTVCLLSSPPCESRHPVMFFFVTSPCSDFFFYVLEFSTSDRLEKRRHSKAPDAARHARQHTGRLRPHHRGILFVPLRLGRCVVVVFFFLSFFTFGKQTGG